MWHKPFAAVDRTRTQFDVLERVRGGVSTEWPSRDNERRGEPIDKDDLRTLQIISELSEGT